MQELIEVFRMKELTVDTRAKILIELGKLINFKYARNITEPLIYELIKTMDLKSDFLNNPFLQKLKQKEHKDE